MPGGSEESTAAALEACAQLLRAKLGSPHVDLVLCFCTEHHAAAHVLAAASRVFVNVPFAANTTHGGLVTDQAVCRSHSAPAVMALWAIRDGAGCFEVAAEPVEAHSDDAYERAAEAAAARAVRACRRDSVASDHDHDPNAPAPRGDGQLRSPPVGGRGTHSGTKSGTHSRHEELTWLYTAPGCEEAALRGLRRAVPASTLTLGSTSADEGLLHRWWQVQTLMGWNPMSPNEL